MLIVQVGDWFDRSAQKLLKEDKLFLFCMNLISQLLVGYLQVLQLPPTALKLTCDMSVNDCLSLYAEPVIDSRSHPHSLLAGIGSNLPLVAL